MPDILETNSKQSKPSGLRQPAAMSTIVGGKARTNNKYKVEGYKQPSISSKRK